MSTLEYFLEAVIEAVLFFNNIDITVKVRPILMSTVKVTGLL